MSGLNTASYGPHGDRGISSGRLRRFAGAWLGAWGVVAAVSAQPGPADGYLDASGGIQLGAEARQALQSSATGMAGALQYKAPVIRPTGNDMGKGAAYFTTGVYTGTFRRVRNPYSGNRYWVLDEGTYERADEVRYTGRFHYFHRDGKAYRYYEEEWVLAESGRYFFVGVRTAADGARTEGIYSADAGARSLPDFMPADAAYLDGFARRYAGQVEAFRRAQAGREAGGLSFGQVLALGLEAAALSQAGMSGVDTARIGGAFAADVLTDGRAGALPAVSGAVAGSSARGAHHPAVTAENAARTATARATAESVTVSCPSGVSRSIPISYKPPGNAPARTRSHR